MAPLPPDALRAARRRRRRPRDRAHCIDEAAPRDRVRLALSAHAAEGEVGLALGLSEAAPIGTHQDYPSHPQRCLLPRVSWLVKFVRLLLPCRGARARRAGVRRGRSSLWRLRRTWSARRCLPGVCCHAAASLTRLSTQRTKAGSSCVRDGSAICAGLTCFCLAWTRRANYCESARDPPSVLCLTHRVIA